MHHLVPVVPPPPSQPVPCQHFLSSILPSQTLVYPRTTDDQFILGGYAFIRTIGTGGFGTVFLAKHLYSPGFCAVKFSQQSNLNRESQLKVEALKDEYTILSQVSHKNIVKCLGLIHTDDFSKWYLFMEYMNMGSLKSILNNTDEPLGEGHAAYITTEILEGLVFLELRGIVHRDIKADNILIHETYTIKIGDFGISKRLYPLDAGEYGLQTKKIGTLSHMAPEIRFSNQTRSYDGRVDIWSLGCTVLEMLTGQDPKINFVTTVNGYNCTYDRPQGITDDCYMFIQRTLDANDINRPFAQSLIRDVWVGV